MGTFLFSVGPEIHSEVQSTLCMGPEFMTGPSLVRMGKHRTQQALNAGLCGFIYLFILHMCGDSAPWEYWWNHKGGKRIF